MSADPNPTRNMNFDQLREALRTGDPPPEQIIAEIRSRLDRSYYFPEQGNSMLQAIPDLLDKLKAMPHKYEECKENKMRSDILEIIQKCPVSEAMKSIAGSLVKIMVGVILYDNENNAIMAIKIFVEYCRIFKDTINDQLIEQTQKFAEKLFKNSREILEQMKNRRPGHFLQSSQSHRVLVECGNCMSVLYNINLRRSNQLNDLILYAFEIVIRDDYKEFQSTPCYSDFLSFKTRILTFLTQFSPSVHFKDVFISREEALASAIITLMKALPIAHYHLKKDLLQGLSIIMKSAIKPGFVKYIDTIMNEGENFNSIRSIWYSFILDFIEIFKADMKESQLCTATAFICRSFPLHVQYHLQSLTILQSILDNIRSGRDGRDGTGRVQRERNPQQVEIIYQIILLMISERLQYCCTLMEEALPLQGQQRNLAMLPTKSLLNIHELGLVHRRLIMLSRIVISDKLAANSPNGTPSGIVHDQETVYYISKIFRYGILYAKIYQVTSSVQREEETTYESIANILSTLHPTSLKDLLKDLLPFLFVRFLDSQHILKLLEYIKNSTKREHKHALGDIIMPFVIDNLEVLEQDSNGGEARLIELYEQAGITPSDEIDRQRVRKRLWNLVELILTLEVLELHGVRFIRKCEELCKSESISKFTLLATNCISMTFKNQDLRNMLATLWVQRQEPIYQEHPPQHIIFRTLSLRIPEKTNQACLIIYENIDNIEVTPSLLKKLFSLMASPKVGYSNEIMKILVKLAPKIRENRQAVSVKTYDWFARVQQGNFPFPVITDSQQHDFFIPQEYILSKIPKCFKTKTQFENEKDKKTLTTACKIVYNATLAYLNKLTIDSHLIVGKARQLLHDEPYDPPERIVKHTTLQLNSIRAGLHYTIESYITLVMKKDAEQVFIDLYNNLCAHLGLLCFASIEGTPIDFGVDVHRLIEGICDKLAYTEKGTDLYLAALRGLDCIINTVKEVLQKNAQAIEKSETIKLIFDTIIRCSYKTDWNLQIGAIGGLKRLLVAFPSGLVNANASLILTTALHVIQCKQLDYIQLLEEPLKLIEKMAEKLSREDVLFHLANALFSPMQVMREFARNLLKEYGLLESFKSETLNILCLGEPMKLEAIVLQHNFYTEAYKKIVFLELLSFCIREGLIEYNKPCVEALLKVLSLTVEETKAHYERDDRRGADEDTADRFENLAKYQLIKEYVSSDELTAAAKNVNGELTANLKKSICFSLLWAISYNNEDQIVSTVRSAIELIIQKHCDNNNRNILPPEDLKSCLRPILQEFTRKSTQPSYRTIRNFSRLLQVIPSCFNNALAGNIIKHLHSASTEPRSEKLAFIVDSINLFPYLPDCIMDIMDKIIETFVRAEEALQRNTVLGYLNSPFHLPLIKYLVRFPESTKKYFFDSDTLDRRMIGYLITLLEHPMAYSLREIVAENYIKIIEKFLIADGEGLYQGMRIVSILVHFIPNWISTKSDLIDCIYAIWEKQKERTSFPETEIIKASFLEKYMVECFISYLTYNHSKSALQKLLELPNSFARNNLWNSDFLSVFLSKDLPRILSTEQKTDLMDIVIEHLNSKPITDNEKYRLIEHLVIPFLTETFEHSDCAQLITKRLQHFTISLFRKHLVDYSNIFCVQLMNLASLFIENMKDEFFYHRREIIKFFWGMIKSENPFIKGSAYVNVARFIKIYSLPDTLTVQLLGALLKAHHAELAHSAYQAFNYLSSKLILLFREPRFRDYLSDFVDKNLQNETKTANSMMHVIEIIIKNSDVFYHIRDKLSQHFFSWINHLGLGLHSSIHAKKTLLELTNLMIVWSEQHGNEQGSESFLASSHKEMLINFFARFGQAPALYISRMPNKNPDHMNYLSGKCITNMKYALGLWKDVNFKARNWTEALKKCVNLVQQQPQPAQNQQRGNSAEGIRKLLDKSLEIIKILADNSTVKDIIQFPDLVKYLALQVKALDTPALIEKLCNILSVLLSHQPNDLLLQLKEILDSALREPQQSQLWCISLLKVISKASPAELMNHMKGFLHLTFNIVNEYKDSADNAVKDPKIKSSAKTSLKIVKKSLLYMCEEHRKLLYQIVSTIFSHNADQEITVQAIRILDKWIDTEDCDLDQKDQCLLLLKLFGHQGTKRAAPLKVAEANEALTLALKVLQNSFDCYEPKNRLIKAIFQFLLADTSHRLKPDFDRLFKESVGNSLWRIMLLIFEQDEFYDHMNWIKTSMEMILLVLEDYGIEQLPEYDMEMDIEGDRGTIDFVRKHVWGNCKTYAATFTSASKFLGPLREFLNNPFAHYLFVNLFPQIWNSLGPSQKSTLSISIESFLLQKDAVVDHQVFNPCSTVLLAISNCYPLPIIRPEVLQFVAKTQNCWSVVLPLLETYYTQMPDVFTSTKFLTTLYDRLNEDELSLGWKLRDTKNPQLRDAFKAMLSKEWVQSRDLLEGCFAAELTDTERFLNEQAWTRTLFRLADWDSLGQYTQLRHSVNQITVAWHSGNLLALQQAIDQFGLETHPHCIYYSTLSRLEQLGENTITLKEAEKQLEVMNKGIQGEWNLVPRYPSAVHMTFLDLMELRGELVDCLSVCRRLEDQPTIPISNSLDVFGPWRNKKLICQLNPPFVSTLLKARKAMMKTIKTVCHRYQGVLSNDSLPSSIQVPLNANMAKLYRKSGLFHKALVALKETPEDESFASKIREIIHLAADSHQVSAALEIAVKHHNESLISSVSRLKGKLMWRRLQNPEAGSFFGHACSVSPKDSRNWLAWGEFLAEQYRITSEPHLVPDSLDCLLLGIHAAIDKATIYAPLLLYLLKHIEQVGSHRDLLNQLPGKFWAGWAHEILEALRTSGECMTHLLQRLAESAPYELFFALRVHLIKARETEGSNVFAVLKDTLEQLRAMHPVLTASMNYFAYELTNSFRPSPEEDLLSTLNTILHYPGRITEEEAGSLVRLMKEKFFEVSDAAMSLFELKNDFSADCTPAVLQDSVAFLRLIEKWQGILQRLVRTKTDEFVYARSPTLAGTAFKELPLPGTDKKVMIDRVLPSVEILYAKNCSRVLAMRGYDGLEYRFILFVHEPYWQEHYRRFRVTQFFNETFRTQIGTMGHNIRGSDYAEHTIVPLDANRSLVSFDIKSLSFRDIYNLSVEEAGIPRYGWISEPQPLPHNLLSTFMQVACQVPDRYLVTRAQFIAQYALLHLYCSLFGVDLQGQTLDNLWVDKSSGTFNLPLFDAPCFTAETEPSARWTSNIKTIVGIGGVNGLVPAVVKAAAKALLKKPLLLQTFLTLEFEGHAVDVLARLEKNLNIDYILACIESASGAEQDPAWIPEF